MMQLTDSNRATRTKPEVSPTRGTGRWRSYPACEPSTKGERALDPIYQVPSQERVASALLLSPASKTSLFLPHKAMWRR